MSRKNVRNVRPQLSKAERELARLEAAIVVASNPTQRRRPGQAQAAGVHADQNRRHGGKAARGGRQGERRSWAA